MILLLRSLRASLCRLYSLGDVQSVKTRCRARCRSGASPTSTKRDGDTGPGRAVAGWNVMSFKSGMGDDNRSSSFGGKGSSQVYRRDPHCGAENATASKKASSAATPRFLSPSRMMLRDSPSERRMNMGMAEGGFDEEMLRQTDGQEMMVLYHAFDTLDISRIQSSPYASGIASSRISWKRSMGS